MWSSKPAVRQDTFVGSIATPWALEDLSLPTRPIALDTRQAATGSEESIQALESEREALTREIAALQERMEQQVGKALALRLAASLGPFGAAAL